MIPMTTTKSLAREARGRWAPTTTALTTAGSAAAAAVVLFTLIRHATCQHRQGSARDANGDQCKVEETRLARRGALGGARGWTGKRSHLLKRRKTSFSMRCSSLPAPQRPGPAPCAARSKEVSASVGERALVWAAGTAVRPVVSRSECARRARQLRRPQARAGAAAGAACLHAKEAFKLVLARTLHSISSAG